MKRLFTYVFLTLSASLLVPPILRSEAVYEVPMNAATTHFPVIVASQEQTSTPEASTTATEAALANFVQNEAIKYGVNPDLADCLVFHESQWQTDRIGDIGNPNGESVGLWQIEIQQHPDVTKAEALDPYWATDWALSKIASGSVSMWSTFSQRPFYCRSIPVFLTN